MVMVCLNLRLHSGVMRFLGFVLLVGLSGFAGASHGAPFSESLSDRERKEAGLERLTPDERAVLDELIALYQEGRLEEVREIAERAAAALAAVEMEARLADAKEEAALEATQEMEVRIEEIRDEATAEAVKVVEAKIEAEKRFVAVVEGTFRGWSGRTRFRLDNGQVWMQKRDAMYNPGSDQEAVVVIEKVSYDQYRLIYTKTGANVPVTRIK